MDSPLEDHSLFRTRVSRYLTHSKGYSAYSRSPVLCNYFFHHIRAQGFSSYGSKGAIVTGQPGTGMWQVFSLMVHNLSFKARRYLLARLLQLKQVILFSVDEEILLFYHGSVHRAKRDQITSSDLPEPRHLGIFTRTSLLHDRCSTFTSADSVT